MTVKTELKPCPFCGEIEDLQILNQGDVVGWECHYSCDKMQDSIAELNHTWFVNCPTCGTCGPDFYVSRVAMWGQPKTDDECKEKAIEAWNTRYKEES